MELGDLASLVIVLNFWFEELGIFSELAVKVLVSGSETHFGLDDHEWEETMPASPFSGCKLANRGCKMSDEVSNKVEGGLPHNCIEWDCFHPPLTILVMEVTVSMIADTVAPFLY